MKDDKGIDGTYGLLHRFPFSSISSSKRTHLSNTIKRLLCLLKSNALFIGTKKIDRHIGFYLDASLQDLSTPSNWTFICTNIGKTGSDFPDPEATVLFLKRLCFGVPPLFFSRSVMANLFHTCFYISKIIGAYLTKYYFLFILITSITFALSF